MPDKADVLDLTVITAGIVSAYLANNSVAAGELPGVISATHAALADLGAPAAEPTPEKPKAAVSLRKSLANPEAILSMIDGKPYRMLRKHISHHGYTPESYRKAFGLPSSYPMVAPAYAAMRGEMARNIGLGRKPKPAETASADAVASATTRPRKLSGAAALAKVRSAGSAAEG